MKRYSIACRRPCGDRVPQWTVAAINWATRYDYHYGWLRLPVLDARGRLLRQRGVSPVHGLHFLGLHWMHTFKSGLFSGVGADAEYLAERTAQTAVTG
jgi:putative flavoprotein involved in K+ transport